MSFAASLCFTKDGLVNTPSLKLFESNPNVNTVGLFGDGTEEALEHIAAYIEKTSSMGKANLRFGLGRTPRYELRVKHRDGRVSRPHYVISDEVKAKWICAKIAAPYLKIYLSDISAEDGTEAELNSQMTEAVCYLSYNLWNLLQGAQDVLAFPAVIIDRLVQFTYYLTRETMDIEKLRGLTGFSKIAYNSNTDMLSVDVAGETFEVKLTTLNALYGEMILPFFNKIYGRRLSIKVAMTNGQDVTSTPVAMSFGDLGRAIEEMHIYVKERRVTPSDPIPLADLTEFTKRVLVDDSTCVWVGEHETVAEAIERNRHLLLSVNDANNAIHQGEPVAAVN